MGTLTPAHRPLWLPGRPKRRLIRRPDLRDLATPRLSGAVLDRDEIDYDLLRTVRAWRTFEPDTDAQIRYFMWELAQKNPGEELAHFYKAVRFVRLRRVPRYMRQQGSGVGRPGIGQMSYVLSALREQGALFTQMVVKTPEVPLVYAYGVQAVGDTPEEAQENCDQAYAALCGLLDGTFQQLEYGGLTLVEGESIARHSAGWNQIAVARGRPMPTGEAVGASALLDGNRTDVEQTHNQMESFLRGMSELPGGFMLNLITTPVSIDEMTLAWGNIAARLSSVASEVHGAKSFNFGMAIPLAMGHGTGEGTSASHSTSHGRGESIADGTSHSLGVTAGESVSDSISTSHTEGTSQSISEGVSASHSVGVSESVAHGTTQGVSESQSVSHGVSESQSISQGISESASQSAGHSLSASESVGQSASESFSQGTSTGTSESLGQSTSTSMSQGVSETNSHSMSLSESQSISQGVSESHSQSESVTASQSTGTNVGQSTSVSEGASVSEGTSLTTSHGTSLSQSVSLSQAVSDTLSEALSRTNGSSFSGGLLGIGGSGTVSSGETSTAGTGTTETAGTGLTGGSTETVGVGTTQTAGLSQTIGSSSSVGASSSQGLSQGLSVGNTIGASQSVGQSIGATEGVGTSHATSLSQGLSQGVSHTAGVSASQSASQGVSAGTSASQSVGTGQSYTEGIAVGSTASTGASVGSNASSSASVGQSASTSQTHATGTSVSDTTGTSRTVGASTSASDTVGSGRTVGQSLSQSETVGQSASTGQNRATADAYMVAMSRQASQSGSFGVVPSAGLSISKQTLDAGKEMIASVIREQMKRYIDGVEGGAYLYQMFLIGPDKETIAAGAALLKAAFWGPGNANDRVGQPFHVLTEFDEDERRRLLEHARAFTSDRSREERIELIEAYRFSSYATVGELSAFARPPVAENLGLLAVHDSAPVMAMPDNRAARELMLGRVFNGERGRVSKMSFGIDSDEITHVLVAGSTGAGKTQTTLKLMSELTQVTRKIVDPPSPGRPLGNTRQVPASVLAIDWMRNMRHLGSIVEPISVDPTTGEKRGRYQFFSVRDTRIGGFRWNPLHVPDATMSPVEWLNAMSDNMVASWNLGEFGRSLISEYLDRLYRANRLEPFVLRPEKIDPGTGQVLRPAIVLDPVDRSTLPPTAIGTDEVTGDPVANVYTYPELSRLIGVQHLAVICAAELEAAATVEGGRAGTSMRDRLQSLWRRVQYFAPGGQMEDLIACDTDLTAPSTLVLSDLIDPDRGLVTVIETDGLDLANRRFVLGSVLLAMYRVGLHRGEGYFNQGGQGAGLFCVLEEAHELFGSKGEDEDAFSASTRTALYESMHRRIRAIGARLIDVVQNPGDVPDSITSNTSTVIVHRLSSKADRECIMNLLNWSNQVGQQQREFRYLGELGVGQAIIRLQPRNNWLEAAPIQIQVEPAVLGHVTDNHLAAWAARRG